MPFPSPLLPASLLAGPLALIMPTTAPVNQAREYLDLIAAGTFTVAAVALLLASLSARAAHKKQLTRDRASAWVVAATVMVLFAAIKTLNAFFLVQDIFRNEAKADGFYERRRMLQVMATLGAGFLAVILGAMLKNHIPTFRRNWLISACIILIGATGLIRLISLHQIDEFFADLPAIRYGLEPLLALVIIIAAWRRRGEYAKRLSPQPAKDAATALQMGRWGDREMGGPNCQH